MSLAMRISAFVFFAGFFLLYSKAVHSIAINIAFVLCTISKEYLTSTLGLVVLPKTLVLLPSVDVFI
jgi:hypothetical protein